MSAALQYRINDRTEDYIFMSPWVDQDTPDILAKDFQRPLKMLRKGVKHYDGLAAAAYQKKSPDLYTESMMYLNVKQWDINQWSEGPEGILHADPIQNNRLRYAMQDSMLVCDCAPTEFEGVDFNAYDIIAFDAQANHRQPAIYGGRINDGRRTMAHLAFVHEI